MVASKCKWKIGLSSMPIIAEVDQFRLELTIGKSPANVPRWLIEPLES
jgi:hypothetical protein